MTLPLPLELPDNIDALEQRMRPSLKANVMLWLIAAFIIAFLLWAAFAQIDRSVNGLGRVVTSSQLQTISNLEGGIIEDILVKSGQDVLQGTPLLRLSPIMTQAELGSGEATVAGLVAKVARLEAELKDSIPLFPASGEPAMQGQIDIERALYRSRRAEIEAINASGSAHIVMAQRALQEANAILSARLSAQSAAMRELDAIAPLVERGIEPRLTLISAEANLARTTSETAAARATVARTFAGISEARASGAQQVQDWRSRSGAELSAAQAELSARRSTLPALADRLKRTAIVAPINGRINRVLVTTRGSSVGAGSPLIEMVPSGEELIIEAMILPRDIASVRTNQLAQISITAYDSNIYGRLKGRVISISPDAVIHEKSGESFYIVKVRTDTNALVSPAGGRLLIGPGMIANVSLLGDKRSVLSYLLDPLIDVKNKALRE